MKPAHLLVAVAIAAIWGFNFVVIKTGVHEVPPFLLTGLRFLFSAVPALFFISRPNVPIKYLLAFGFVLGVGQFGFLFLAMKLGLSASLASLVMQLQAPFTIFFASVFLAEVPLRRQLLGAAIAFAGIALIAYKRWSGPDLVPLVLCLIACAGWAGANIVAKLAKPDNTLAFVIWSSLVSPLPMFILSFIFEDHAALAHALLHPSILSVAALLYLVLASTLFGYGAWNYLLKLYPAGTVAPFSLLVPIFGILSGVLILGEHFDGYEILGSIGVVTGLVIANFGDRFTPKKKADPKGSAV
jgi:O-acetylserine/cysteine efflux transporter